VQAWVRVSVKAMVRVTFYFYYVSTKPNCTLLVRYYHVTGSILIGFQISRSAGINPSHQKCNIYYQSESTNSENQTNNYYHNRHRHFPSTMFTECR